MPRLPAIKHSADNVRREVGEPGDALEMALAGDGKGGRSHGLFAAKYRARLRTGAAAASTSDPVWPKLGLAAQRFGYSAGRMCHPFVSGFKPVVTKYLVDQCFI